MTPLRQRMLEDMQIRNFTLRTQETYISQVSKFAKYFKRSPEVLGPEEIREYQLYLIRQKVSWSLFNQAVCALRFLYGKTLKVDLGIEQIPFPKQPKKLPELLSPTEVAKLLQTISGQGLIEPWPARVLLAVMIHRGVQAIYEWSLAEQRFCRHV